MRVVSSEVKNNILEIFNQNPDGSVTSTKKPHKPVLLANNQSGSLWERLQGNSHFNSIKHCSSEREMWEERKRIGDVFAIYNSKNAARLFCDINWFQGLNITDVGTLAIDIEATTLERNKDSMVLAISTTFRQSNHEIKKLFSFDEYESQAKLIEAFCKWVREIDPSVIVAHSAFGYDLPYLYYVARMNGVKLAIGRDGSEVQIDSFKSYFRVDGSTSYEYQNISIYGREIVCTWHLAQKADSGRKFPNYKLKDVIQFLGLQQVGRVFYDASTILKNYKDPAEWAKIKAYCEGDSLDAINLYFYLAPPFFYLTRFIPRSYQSIINSATGGQINAWLIKSYLSIGYSIPEASDPVEFEGAISIGNPGVYHHVFKVDVASLYPSIILEYQIYDPVKDPKGHFLKMVSDFTAERLKQKAIYKQTGSLEAKAMSDSLKIIVNSAYGLLNAKVNFNSPEKAASVTQHGRQILMKAIEWCEAKV